MTLDRCRERVSRIRVVGHVAPQAAEAHAGAVKELLPELVESGQAPLDSEGGCL